MYIYTVVVGEEQHVTSHNFWRREQENFFGEKNIWGQLLTLLCISYKRA